MSCDLLLVLCLKTDSDHTLWIVELFSRPCQQSVSNIFLFFLLNSYTVDVPVTTKPTTPAAGIGGVSNPDQLNLYRCIVLNRTALLYTPIQPARAKKCSPIKKDTSVVICIPNHWFLWELRYRSWKAFGNTNIDLSNFNHKHNSPIYDECQTQ